MKKRITALVLITLFITGIINTKVFAVSEDWKNYLLEHSEYKYAAFIELAEDNKEELLVSEEERYTGGSLSLLVCGEDGIRKYGDVATYRNLKYDKQEHALKTVIKEADGIIYVTRKIEQGNLWSHYIWMRWPYGESQGRYYRKDIIENVGIIEKFDYLVTNSDYVKSISESDYKEYTEHYEDSKELEKIQLTPTYELLNNDEDSYELSFERGRLFGYYMSLLNYETNWNKSKADKYTELKKVYKNFESKPSPELFNKMATILEDSVNVYEELRFGKNTKGFLDGVFVSITMESIKVMKRNYKLSEEHYKEYLEEVEYLLESPENRMDHYQNFMANLADKLK